MKDHKVLSWEEPAELDAKSPLEEQLIAQGARKMLQAAIEQEVLDHLKAPCGQLTARGRATVVRNGHLPERRLVTGVGPIPGCQRRVRHRDGQRALAARSYRQKQYVYWWVDGIHFNVRLEDENATTGGTLPKELAIQARGGRHSEGHENRNARAGGGYPPWRPTKPTQNVLAPLTRNLTPYSEVVPHI